ncbi:GNAT family N-acetyltransferase [Rossellomorea vietnamensis]|uniref:GNAT family N-acetyltransferase n=1 Tax=Rossellomorea vietnamensis TaxID=218284 RepID=UPI001E39E171|nr:GNAT family N-acetyltransferase [Rossellomorea vietnamensis]MCC5803689.1 GNAT family N-acetyltransferase [Rossellomorea vietnamensis]
MKVFRARLSNLEGLVTLFNDYRMFYHQKSDPVGARQYLEKRLSHDESVIFVAIHNDEYAGFTQLYPSFSSVYMERIWKLNDLYVSTKVRRLGAGQLLLDAAKEHAVQTSAKSLILETDRDNVQAQALYERNGYVMEETVYHYTLKLK